ncbi:MAG: DNA/RNA helicase, partial [Prochlorothrix sp.]
KLPGQMYSSPNIFRMDGKITISNIFRAKGNEAWKVYVCRFQYVNSPLAWKNETEVEKRNEAFVGLTRARVWCVVTGLEDNIFDELDQAIKTPPNLSFPAFNKRSLRRVTDEADAE